MSNAGWTDETEVDFEGTPDELVNLPEAIYVFDIAKVSPKKTKKGEQALEVVLKAVSLHGGGELPTGAKSLYETIVFGDNLITAKNLLKSAGVAAPKKINFEVLTELSNELLAAKQVIAKTGTQAASGGYAAKSRVSRYYSEESLAKALESGDDPVVAAEAPVQTKRVRRGASEAIAA